MTAQRATACAASPAQAFIRATRQRGNRPPFLSVINPTQESNKHTPAQMLKLTMSLAYRIVFECPKDRKNINLQKKCSNISLSESDAMKMFGNEEIACTNPNCGWHGKARRTRLLRILPFDWVLAPAG